MGRREVKHAERRPTERRGSTVREKEGTIAGARAFPSMTDGEEKEEKKNHEEKPATKKKTRNQHRVESGIKTTRVRPAEWNKEK